MLQNQVPTMNYYYSTNHGPTVPSGSSGQFVTRNVNIPPYAHVSGTRRMSLREEPCKRDEVDIEFEIHSMEKEAYSSVLRAFIAQSDLLSWGKEGLITELRRELNVTDIEHGQLLVKINSDKSIKRIREWRKGGCGSPSGLLNTPGLASESVDNSPLRRRGACHPSASKSHSYATHGQPSTDTVPPSEPAHRRYVQQGSELAIFSSGNPPQSMRAGKHNIQGLLRRKGGGPMQSQLNRVSCASNSSSFHLSELIEIHETDKIIHEVETMAFGGEKPRLVQVEKAKLVLKEHERALLEALDKLANVSDDDDPASPHHYSYAELQRNACGMPANDSLHRQEAGLLGYPSEALLQTHSVRLRTRSYVEIQDDEETP